MLFNQKDQKPFTTLEASAPPPTYYSAVSVGGAQGDLSYQAQSSAPIVIQPVIVGTNFYRLSSRPQNLTCPNCGANIITNVEYRTGLGICDNSTLFNKNFVH